MFSSVGERFFNRKVGSAAGWSNGALLEEGRRIPSGAAFVPPAVLVYAIVKEEQIDV